MSLQKNKDSRWSSLRKCWNGYKISKKQGRLEEQKAYAKTIISLAEELGLKKPEFPELNE